MGIEPTLPAWKAGVLPLNYTRKNTLKPKQMKSINTQKQDKKVDTGGGGRIRTYVDMMSTDLQSVAFNHSATPPHKSSYLK